jgi:hypothetical protein
MTRVPGSNRAGSATLDLTERQRQRRRADDEHHHKGKQPVPGHEADLTIPQETGAAT